jgi:hypothetical protein
MKRVIRLFDFYGKNVPLYTKSYPKATTFLGFIFSIITLVLLCFILYFQCSEVFVREHPNVVSYRQNINKNNSTLTISNNTFNFFISIKNDNKKENLLNYFLIESNINFRAENHQIINISYEHCNDNDKSKFKQFIKEFKFPENSINLCPRINFTEVENVRSFQNFDFNFTIGECVKNISDCTVDENFYKEIREGRYIISSYLYWLDNQLDLTNYEKPYWYIFRNLPAPSNKEVLHVELEGSQINSQVLFNFNAIEKQSQFSYATYFRVKKPSRSVISCFIVFDSKDMYIYNRTYKTFNSAFAETYALFGLISKIISFILYPYYTYYMNTAIINKNFNYELSTRDGGFRSVNTDMIGKDVSQDLTVKFVKPKGLTSCTVFKNVSLLRLFCCRKRNRIKTFYDYARLVIYKHLSVETLLRQIIDLYRVKKYLFMNNDSFISPQREKLIVDTKDGKNKKDLGLDILINSLDIRTDSIS